jgi:preprotein translocase subunit SecA
LEYDDVINKHREIIYSRRNKILNSENIDADIQKMIREELSIVINSNLK